MPFARSNWVMLDAICLSCINAPFVVDSFIIQRKSTPWGASVSVLKLVDQLLCIWSGELITFNKVRDQHSDLIVVNLPPSLDVCKISARGD